MCVCGGKLQYFTTTGDHAHLTNYTRLPLCADTLRAHVFFAMHALCMCVMSGLCKWAKLGLALFMRSDNRCVHFKDTVCGGRPTERTACEE